MLAQAYHDLKKKHEKEISDFPIAFAFNDKQLKEALEKLNADISEVCTYLEIGDVIRKKDVPAFKNMLLRHRDEIYIFLTNNKQDAYEAFRYEMENHEYAINWDGDADVLGEFNLTEKKLHEFGLNDIYYRAQRDYMKDAIDNEWF